MTSGAAGHRARLAAERQAVSGRLEALHGDFDAMVATSEGSNADDEHDPEGSTIAYERSQLSALMEQAERHLTEIADAEAWLATGTYGARLWPGHPGGASPGPACGPHLRRLRLTGGVQRACGGDPNPPSTRSSTRQPQLFTDPGSGTEVRALVTSALRGAALRNPVTCSSFPDHHTLGNVDGAGRSPRARNAPSMNRRGRSRTATADGPTHVTAR